MGKTWPQERKDEHSAKMKKIWADRKAGIRFVFTEGSNEEVIEAMKKYIAEHGKVDL